MSSTVKESDLNARTSGFARANPPAATTLAENSVNKTQPVALEVSVTVNGVRSVEGGKREPFSETSKTVLVFSNGAVIRLTAALSPGQLLFLTNEKTKKEVVCQVVKSKNYRNVSGYVEIEFTEPLVGFWGMRFPNDRAGSAPAAPPPVATISPAPPPAVPSIVELPVPSAILVPAPPEPAVSKPVDLQIVKQEPITLSSPEISASILEPSTSPEKKWQPEPESSEAIKLHTARLQEQLSSMLFSGTEGNHSDAAPFVAASLEKELPSEIASKFIEIPEAQTTPSFEPSPVQGAPNVPNAPPDEESIKIPAWLEPLARNTTAPDSSQELIERAQAKLSVEVPEASQPDPDAISPAEAEHTPELRIPSFGSQLPIDERQSGAERTSGGLSKGMLIGSIAAVIFLIAGGGFWYTKQQSGSSHPVVAPMSPAGPVVVAVPVQQPPVTSAPAQTSSIISSAEASHADAASHTVPVFDTSENSKSTDRVTPAASKIAQPASTLLQPRPQSQLKTETQPQPATPSLGKVHLKGPKVNRKIGPQDSGSGDPGLAMSAEQVVPNSDSINDGLVTGSVQGPAAPVAPLPVGGDVKPAKLLSSVPPVYPSLARNQHVGGAVKIDALIDANGRVTSMNVLSGPTLLHQAAMDALHQWKYQPATLDGKPVSMHLTITIQFRLQ